MSIEDPTRPAIAWLTADEHEQVRAMTRRLYRAGGMDAVAEIKAATIEEVVDLRMAEREAER